MVSDDRVDGEPDTGLSLLLDRAAPCEKISKWQRLVWRKIAAHSPTLKLDTY